jgi:hypothetical protein
MILQEYFKLKFSDDAAARAKQANSMLVWPHFTAASSAPIREIPSARAFGFPRSSWR